MWIWGYWGLRVKEGTRHHAGTKPSTTLTLIFSELDATALPRLKHLFIFNSGNLWNRQARSDGFEETQTSIKVT